MPSEFHLSGGAWQWTRDSADTGTAPDLLALTDIPVTFECNIPSNKALPIPGGIIFVGKRAGKILADGSLVDEQGNPGIDLIGDDPTFELLKPVQWRIKVGAFTDANGQKVRPVAYWVNAPAPGASKSIDELTPVPGVAQPGGTRGLRGFTPWFVPVAGSSPPLFQATDPNGPVGPSVPFSPDATAALITATGRAIAFSIALG